MVVSRSNQHGAKSCPERTPLARRPLLDGQQTSELESLFKVLGNGTRLRLVYALVKKGRRDVCRRSGAADRNPDAGGL